MTAHIVPQSVEDCIGISPLHLHKVYPYHIAIDEGMKITQLGAQLRDLFLSNKDLTGTPIQSLFDITSPKCEWNLDSIIKHEKTSKFVLQLKNPMFYCKKPVVSLKGGVIVSTKVIDYKQTATILFLLSLNFTDYSDMRAGGFAPATDVTRYAFQEELFLLSKLCLLLYCLYSYAYTYFVYTT